MERLTYCEASSLLCLLLQIAAALFGPVECGERMGLLPPETHNGQRGFREVFALLTLRAQSAVLGKSNGSAIPAGGHGWTRLSQLPDKAPKGIN